MRLHRTLAAAGMLVVIVTVAAVVSDGSPFQKLAASEFKSTTTEHGIQISPAKPGKVRVTFHVPAELVEEAITNYGTYSREYRASA
ncbi:MAG: hypothetical protein IH933_00030 [Euryarchaeota archaeon]|nr:hypothetical protein [Euryarchaeota archaeon]